MSLFYCCCWCRLYYSVFFSPLISCVYSPVAVLSLALLSCFLSLCLSFDEYACLCVCSYCRQMSAQQNWTWQFSFWLLTRFDCFFRLFLTSHHCRRIQPININLYLIVRWVSAVCTQPCFFISSAMCRVQLLYQIPCILFGSNRMSVCLTYFAWKNVLILLCSET